MLLSGLALVRGLEMQVLEMALIMALGKTIPEMLGPKRCRKRGIGALLRDLRRETPENGIGPLLEQRRATIKFLEANCRRCGRCRGDRA